ncbi:hypothetical protein [Promicromonospora iranensis]|uniref:Uncharacterized protein n=1 Tax=Promicromonospora iranensis TaxID=1105144 RepID=A0ABU2CIU9_9MICO|nr:hypothetical protein [Promicromonospora iranensis]MDR7381263.1 hypothetical protein [Promicromonospora iranensis]
MLSETITNMKVVATIDTRRSPRRKALPSPRDQGRDHDSEAGCDDLEAQVPEGWQMLNVRVPDRADTYQPRRH